VFGSFEAFGKNGSLRLGTPVSVTFGRPLRPAEYDNLADGKERYANAAGRIMAAITKIAPPRATVV
jgi:1-acyl-sn-glycerol-3-phosphate acyltransferase